MRKSWNVKQAKSWNKCLERRASLTWPFLLTLCSFLNFCRSPFLKELVFARTQGHPPLHPTSIVLLLCLRLLLVLLDLAVVSHNGAFSRCSASLGEPISSEHFHRAVNVNDEDLLVQILQGGNVKVDVPNKFGFTALMVAAQKGFTRLVKILVSNGTDVNLKNGSGKDSLMLACYAGHLEVVKYLRRHGASWETRDLGGCTALHWAADGGHCNVIEWMLKDGCEVDAVDTGSGWTPLMRVSAVSGNQGVASLLIDAGADVNVRDKDGKTPLMVAVLNNHEELVQLLLDKGADASVKNEFGKGVLEMARVFDRQNVVCLLEERKKKQMPRKSSLRTPGHHSPPSQVRQSRR
uniref:Fibronectin type III and ankyrin repeat domains 1 n=1 Tax=Equus caballus TaxID=9796 RepID=A0A3Q2LE89_HORSE